MNSNLRPKKKTMPHLIHNCPRCGVQRITFDVIGINVTNPGSKATTNPSGTRYNNAKFEAMSVCRACRVSTTFLLLQSERLLPQRIEASGLMQMQDLLGHFSVSGFVTIADLSSREPPDHLPAALASVFKEGAKCAAIGCNNAAGTMYRLCLDMATRALLPPPEEPEPNARTRRDLGLRLPWLFRNGRLPPDLEPLSHCIREDGNDGAHAGTLTNADVADLEDFSVQVLERLYTQPARLAEAQRRREERRKPLAQ